MNSATPDSSLITPNSSFPILVLIVSGGHTELVLMEDHGRYRRLGGTLDDAAGEAFDKAARLLGLPYPGGPMVQRAAEGGNPQAFALPRALLKDPAHRYNFSFSGLKTAVLRVVREQQEASEAERRSDNGGEEALARRPLRTTSPPAFRRQWPMRW